MTIFQQQCLLKFLGYDPGAVDGVDGPKTAAARDRFAEDYGLTGLSDDFIAKALIGAVAGTLDKPEQEDTSDPSDPFYGIKHFRPGEFTCKCGGKYCKGDTATMDHKLLQIDDKIRNHFDAATTITSGIRCRQHNANVGGVANSRHLTGHANDLIVRGFSSAMVLAYAQTLPGVNYAYAIDGSAVHIDTL